MTAGQSNKTAQEVTVPNAFLGAERPLIKYDWPSIEYVA